MSWITTSNTCISVFGALGDARQFDEMTAFDAAGELIMAGLAFYDPLASGDINNANALALAGTLDSSLADTYGGKYKAGFTIGTAVAALDAVLRDGTKTVENLSDSADTIYTFA